MQKHEVQSRESDKRFAAACGLYCEACSWFIATAEDPEKLKRLAAQLHISEEEGKCFGCRSGKGCPIARNARCPPVQLNEVSTFAANVRIIPARTSNNFNLRCRIGSRFGTIWNESRPLATYNGSRKFEKTIPATNAKPSIPPTIRPAESVVNSPVAIT